MFSYVSKDWFKLKNFKKFQFSILNSIKIHRGFRPYFDELQTSKKIGISVLVNENYFGQLQTS